MTIKQVEIVGRYLGDNLHRREKNVCELKGEVIDGLEVERPLRIQLKASHYCLGGSNPAWGMVLAVIIH